MIKFTKIKNKNKKGFAMAELLAVCVVVLTIFTILFSNYLPLVAEYENRSVYNNVTAQYAAHHLRKAYDEVIDRINIDASISDGGFVKIYDSRDRSMNTINTHFSNNTVQVNKLKKLIDEYKIEEIIITNYKLSNEEKSGVKDKLGEELQNGYPASGKLYNYIKYLPTYKNYDDKGVENYRIILKSSEFGYATTAIKYSKALQESMNVPNHPELSDNMLPVKYDNGKWKVVSGAPNDSGEWYNYARGEWANSVIVTNPDKYEIDQEVKISDDDVLTMQVWIPRFKYTVWNYNMTGTLESTEFSKKDTIFIEFENGKSSTGTINCQDLNDMGTDDKLYNGNENKYSENCLIGSSEITSNSVVNDKLTYTHPAFTFEEEVTGFWIGKFEVTGDITNITTKPNTSSIRSKSVSNFDTSIRNMKETYGLSEMKGEDVHMIKNMEWGAVAYLTYSIYGICGKNGCDDTIGYNNNSSGITGCGTKYNSSPSSTYSSNCNKYDTDLGKFASTTGNEYGVYDMSGGSWEYVMGNMASFDYTKSNPVMMSGLYDGSFSGYNGKLYDTDNLPPPNPNDYTEGTPYPNNPKYYDKYSFGSGQESISRSKLGDGIREIAQGDGWDLNQSIMVYAGIYGEGTSRNTNGQVWLRRGGGFKQTLNIKTETNGIFSTEVASGSKHNNVTSRLVITLPPTT